MKDKKYIYIILLCLFSMVCLGILFIQQYMRFSDGKLHVIFCDVGQGDGIYIRTPKGTDIVIDGGPDNKILSCLANNMPFWDRTLDLVILTHPHADHYTGLLTLVERYKVLTFGTTYVDTSSEDSVVMQQQLINHKVTNHTLCQNNKIALPDGVQLQTLWPTICLTGKSIDADLNQSSVVALLSYKEFQVLLTGDAEMEVLEQLTQQIGKIDVLKIPHHGAKAGLDESLLQAISPRLAVISVGKNKYGHPAPQIIKLLEDKNIMHLQTNKNGTIHVVSDGKTFIAR